MKKFTFYLDDDSLKVKTGDKLPLTVAGKAPDLLIYGINDNKNVDLLNVGPTLCSNDPHDHNYLEAAKLESLPEDVTATVVAVESDFGLTTVIVTIDELEAI